MVGEVTIVRREAVLPIAVFLFGQHPPGKQGEVAVEGAVAGIRIGRATMAVTAAIVTLAVVPLAEWHPTRRRHGDERSHSCQLAWLL